MDEKNNLPGQSPEEQLDQLLARFLSEPDEDIPTQAAFSAEEPPAAASADNVPSEEAPPSAEVEAPPAASNDEIAAPELDEGWLGQILDTPEQPAEIGPDEQALAGAGLTHPEDLEFEQILQETLHESPAPEADGGTRPTGELPELSGEIPGNVAGQPSASDDFPVEESDAGGVAADAAVPPPERGPDGAPEPASTPRKARPPKKGAYGLFGIPHVVSTAIWLVLVVFIGAGLGRLIWACATDVLAFGREDQVVTITITAADDLDSIAQKLHTSGLIRYPGLFKLYGKLSDAMEDINTGTFQLNTLFDYHALVDAMSSNQRRVTTQVTIPEGYTCAQIFRLLEEKGVCTAAELADAAANAELGSYWFLEGVDRGTANCLEGYLFPDTYIFYLGHSATGVLGKFLDNFDRKFNDNMKAKLETLNATLSDKMRANGLSEDYIASHQMTVREIVIIASMIERETSGNEESYSISSVIYNRLTDPNAYPYLNIDAALVYITGHSVLTNEDKLIDSPYNTYLYKGLIPGAISNPGRSSLDAALDPKNTAYHYYALDPKTGKHRFFKTYQEHLDFLESLREN